MRVTKELVLKGVGHRESVPVPEFGEDAALVIRPLTDGEYFEVQRLMIGEATFEGGTPEKFMENSKIIDIMGRERDAKYLALSFALSIDDEGWKPEEIAKLPQGVPDRLWSRLATISGFPRAPKKGAKPRRKRRSAAT